MAEVVKDGRTGSLFDPDRPDELAAQARWADEYPDTMEELGRTARQVFEERDMANASYTRRIEI